MMKTSKVIIEQKSRDVDLDTKLKQSGFRQFDIWDIASYGKAVIS